MKRDMELIRKILVAIEDYPHATDTIPLQFEGYCDTDVSYHIKLLGDQGLIEATDCSTQHCFCWRAKRLTWNGHDCIQAIRDESRWQTVKKWVADAGKILTLETVKQAVKVLFQ